MDRCPVTHPTSVATDSHPEGLGTVREDRGSVPTREF